MFYLIIILSYYIILHPLSYQVSKKTTADLWDCNCMLIFQIEQDFRWMAPEQLKHKEHTKMSDVWSFGVLMWEIVNYGNEPFIIHSSSLVLNGALSCHCQIFVDRTTDTKYVDYRLGEHFSSNNKIIKMHYSIYI